MSDSLIFVCFDKSIYKNVTASRCTFNGTYTGCCVNNTCQDKDYCDYPIIDKFETFILFLTMCSIITLGIWCLCKQGICENFTIYTPSERHMQIEQPSNTYSEDCNVDCPYTINMYLSSNL